MRYAISSALLIITSVVSSADDWLTFPSSYTHDPETGLRISQYEPIAAPTAPMATDYRTSGYTHTRSSLNYGPSADNYHRVETWGPPVRPYGEWRFPFRPYSTPYPNWGAPLAGLNIGNGFAGGYGRPVPYSGHRPNTVPGGDQNAPANPPVPGSPDLSARRWDDFRRDRRPLGQNNPLNPYPAGAGTPYPVAPYYDGYYPPYGD